MPMSYRCQPSFRVWRSAHQFMRPVLASSKVIGLAILVSMAAATTCPADEPATEDSDSVPAASSQSGSPHSYPIADAAKSLRVRDGYRIDAVATEPLVIDPVAVRMDRRGRLWVVEMPDYPTGPQNGPAGRVKILHDDDQDGRFDRSTVFADGLLFATGVQPYRDGAIVTAAGQILWLQDTDGDDVADEKSVWFEGFAQGNEQLRANHPTLGPDGWIYVASGLRGGKIVAVDDRFESRDQPLDLRDRDFRFDPDGGKWQSVLGNSQFGITIDDFGRRFGCSNRNPAMFASLDDLAAARDPLLTVRDAITDVSFAGEASHVAPIAEAWTTSNLHAGQFSAACGVMAPGWIDDEHEWLLVCEPTGYLVQRQRLDRVTDDGTVSSVWNATREDTPSEFVASSHSWFRPVDLATGPNHSVFVVDMARAVIEHPDWMPEELKGRPDQWDGNDLGRIWKVSPGAQSTGDAAPFMSEHLASSRSLSPKDSIAAIRWLSATSPWQREMASQFLLESDHPPLRQLAALVKNRDASPAARARAAFLLNRRNAIQVEQLRSLATSNDARLRSIGIQLCGDFATFAKVFRLDDSDEANDAFAADDDPMVQRFMAMLLAADTDSDSQATTQIRARLLATIAAKAVDPWVIAAIGSTDKDALEPLARELLKSPSGGTPADPRLIHHLIQRLAIHSPTVAAETAATIVSAIPQSSDSKAPSSQTSATESIVTTIDVIDAHRRGYRRGHHRPAGAKSDQTWVQFIADLPTPVASIWSDSLRRIAAASLDTSLPDDARVRAIQIATEADVPLDGLADLVENEAAPTVRGAAIDRMWDTDPDWTREFLLDNLESLTHHVRATVMASCDARPSEIRWLLKQIQDDQLPKSIVDPATAKKWCEHRDQQIRDIAEPLFQSDPDRLKIISRYALAANQDGDARAGQKLFAQHCSACHRIDSVGTNVGPDISDSRTKSPEVLLVSILDPGAAIDANFLQYNVLTVDGRVISGLLIDETADAMTLALKGGERSVISRDDIETVTSPGISLMPEGFEQSITVDQMSDLLSYLKNWRYLKTEIPGTLKRASKTP
ncbi:Cytochrome c [Rubripirellula lacrimiformis]|uniref:Cytochrome c n=1 Tax=Rubripirellula lacrimiformis TaxID=1930273 RepID=A0A517N8S8_9BACT|nr:PVC-type heme-binding CxxCH protein [Rubripirellula lacrimiformis]QDT03553.1 Cytochrome c [Rubripirellula lacrimiformis]